MQGKYDHENYAGIKHAAMYWHFLDGVWIVMFFGMSILGGSARRISACSCDACVALTRSVKSDCGCAARDAGVAATVGRHAGSPYSCRRRCRANGLPS
jgi:hypothetical protein